MVQNNEYVINNYVHFLTTFIIKVLLQKSWLFDSVHVGAPECVPFSCAHVYNPHAPTQTTSAKVMCGSILY